MESTQKDTCSLEDKEHRSGSEVCDALRCMVCRDGKWHVSWLSNMGS
jgi:hypothetical protein